MNKENIDIDKLFKDKLYDQETLPEQDSWLKISQKLDKLPATKPAINFKGWFISLGTVLIGGFLVWNYAFKKDASTTAIIDTTKSTPAIEKPSESKELQIVAKENSTSSIAAVEKPNSSAVQTTATKTVVSSDNQRKEVVLPDGSYAFLNRNSSLAYTSNFLQDRTIYITGEVHLNVKSDSDKKVQIQSKNSRTLLSNASVIVKSQSSGTQDEIFITKGNVIIESLAKPQDKKQAEAGNMISVSDNGKTTTAPISDVNYNCWHTQKIIFDNTRLNEVCTTLEKHFNVSFTGSNPEIWNCRFTGIFDKNNLDEILQVLSVSFNLTYKESSQSYTLSGKGCK